MDRNQHDGQESPGWTAITRMDRNQQDGQESGGWTAITLQGPAKAPQLHQYLPSQHMASVQLCAWHSLKPSSEGIFLSYHFAFRDILSARQELNNIFLALGISPRSLPVHRATFSLIPWIPCGTKSLLLPSPGHQALIAFPDSCSAGILGAHRTSYPITTGPQHPSISMLGFTERVSSPPFLSLHPLHPVLCAVGSWDCSCSISVAVAC